MDLFDLSQRAEKDNPAGSSTSISTATAAALCCEQPGSSVDPPTESKRSRRAHLEVDEQGGGAHAAAATTSSSSRHVDSEEGLAGLDLGGGASSGTGGSSTSTLFGATLPALSEDLLIAALFGFFGPGDVEALCLVSRAWRAFVDSPKLWKGKRIVSEDGVVDRRLFRFLGQKVKGTEGTCSKVIFRGNGLVYCMKKARVNPSQEGVPYYMLREIEYHCNVAPMSKVSDLLAVGLHQGALYGFFPYAQQCLYDAIYRQTPPAAGAGAGGGGGPSAAASRDVERTGTSLDMKVVKRFLYQILRDVARCHAFGIMHRNIKPKHILMRGPGMPSTKFVSEEAKEFFRPQDLYTSFACLADFALVRTSSLHARTFTSEVVTLWYRAPEILMGDRYDEKIDVWSVGCVFAEMLQGHPLFPGTCEVDQLFRIFNQLGTPTGDSWPTFEHLPNKTFEFPRWPTRSMRHALPHMVDTLALDLLDRLLCVNPAHRMSAPQALQHPFFHDCRDALEVEIKQWFDCQGVCERPVPASVMDRLYAFETWRVIPARDPFAPVSRQLLTSHLTKWYEECRWKWDPPPPELTSPVVAGQDKKPLWTMTDARTRRTSLVRYLARIIREYDMSLRTFFLALNFADRFLNIEFMFPPVRLTLLMATCLHVASKCEDVSYMGVKQLMRTIPAPSTDQDMLRLEEDVIKVLDFSLCVPTTVDFVVVILRELFVYRAGGEFVPAAVQEGAKYLCYLASFHSGFIATPFSELALCAVWMACILQARTNPVAQEVALAFKSGALVREGVVRCSMHTLHQHMDQMLSACQGPLMPLMVARPPGDDEKFGCFMDGQSLGTVSLRDWEPDGGVAAIG